MAKKPVRMLVVCRHNREPDQNCVQSLDQAGARIVAIIGSAAVVEGDLKIVRTTVRGVAMVFGPKSTVSIKQLLFRQPHLQTAVNMWQASLVPEVPMTDAEASDLAKAIHS